MLAQNAQEAGHPRAPKSYPSRKRRKLTATDTGTVKPTESRRPSTTPSTPTAHYTTSVPVPQQCTSCHRSHPAGGAVLCALCLTPTCLICARQCTAAPPPVSAPPTPRLSDSPTPPATPALRTLALAPSNTNVHVTVNAAAHRERAEKDAERRRKHRPEDDDTDAEGGCGRTLCRACCIENDTTHSITCLDCYGLLPHPGIRFAAPNA